MRGQETEWGGVRREDRKENRRDGRKKDSASASNVVDVSLQWTSGA